MLLLRIILQFVPWSMLMNCKHFDLNYLLPKVVTSMHAADN